MWENWAVKMAIYQEKRPENFEEATKFLDKINSLGSDVNWSIQYLGFGEHFNFFAGYGVFDDFDIDHGTMINWQRMKEIIIESAQSTYDQMKKHNPHLFEKDEVLE